MSNATACSDSGPRRSTSHHHTDSGGVATPTWLGTMSTSTPSPAACAASATRGQRALRRRAVVDLCVVDDVVAVRRTRFGRQHRGQVHPVDAEQPAGTAPARRRPVQIPVLGDLQPIGGTGDRHCCQLPGDVTSSSAGDRGPPASARRRLVRTSGCRVADCFAASPRRSPARRPAPEPALLGHQLGGLGLRGVDGPGRRAPGCAPGFGPHRNRHRRDGRHRGSRVPGRMSVPARWPAPAARPCPCWPPRRCRRRRWSPAGRARRRCRSPAARPGRTPPAAGPSPSRSSWALNSSRNESSTTR